MKHWDAGTCLGTVKWKFLEESEFSLHGFTSKKGHFESLEGWDSWVHGRGKIV